MTRAGLTVFLIDDDPGLRKALGFLLRSVDLDVQAYASAGAFLQRYEPGMRGCLLVDVRMPSMSGLEFQVELRRRGIDLPLVMLTAYADVPMAVRAMQGGAVDFFEKPVNEQALLDCIHRVFAAEAERSEPAAHFAPVAAQRARLTSRQREVFDLLMQGLQNKAIAEALGISVRTVEVHRSKILKTLGAPSVTHLIRELLQRAVSH